MRRFKRGMVHGLKRLSWWIPVPIVRCSVWTFFGHSASGQPLLRSDSVEWGGVVNTIIVETRIRLTRENNGKIMLRGQYAAVTGTEALDMSILGRDVTNLFSLIVDWPQLLVCLLGQRHQYTIIQRS
jgi:hypothetical protein